MAMGMEAAAVAADITMGEPQVYLEKLSAFSRMLRLEGFAVSPQETADAARILTALGMADRAQVQTALRTVFAKTREEQLTFDRVFSGFFISEEAMKAQAAEQVKQQQELEAMRKQADRELERVPMELTEEQRLAYASMEEAERERLRRFAEKYRESARNNPNLYGNFIHSVFAKAILEQQMKLEDAGVGVEAVDPEMGLLYRDISEFKDTEIPKAISIIRDVAQRINGELSARRRSGGHSGKLDFRRTIRKGLETGGSFYRLKYKKKPKRRKHLVLLCDVSGSMMQFSEFALRFIQSLNQVAESSRTFLFSEDMVEADAFSLQDMDAFRGYVRASGVYGRGTDLGTALEKICAMNPAVLNQSTTLLILSDTKTIDQPRAVDALQEAKRLAGRVIWLNPIPENKWKYIRSVGTMSSLCTMVSCSTLGALANACKKLALE